MTDVSIDDIKVAPSPEIIILDKVGENIGKAWAIVADFIRTVEYDWEVKLALHHLPEVVKRHLMNDNILSRLHIAVGKEQKIDVWITKCRGTPHLILRWQCPEVRKNDNDGFHSFVLECYMINNIIYSRLSGDEVFRASSKLEHDDEEDDEERNGYGNSIED